MKDTGNQLMAPHLAGLCNPLTRSISSTAKILRVAQGPHVRLVIGYITSY